MENHLEPEQKEEMHESWLLALFSGVMEWGNRWLTRSGLFLKDGAIFVKLEMLLALGTVFCVSALFWIHLLPPTGAMVLALLLVQRPVEFVVVYCRNFILNRGRIYSHFPDENIRGQWLLIMFGLNILQLLFVFATWYRLISLQNPAAFNHPIGVLDSLYFSVVTFITIGYAEVFAETALPKILVILESLSFFFTLVVVINGLISLHFRQR